MKKTSYNEIINLCKTNNSFNTICEDNYFWKQWILKQNDITRAILPKKIIKKLPSSFWLKWFKKNYYYYFNFKNWNHYIKNYYQFPYNLIKPYFFSGFFAKKWINFQCTSSTGLVQFDPWEMEKFLKLVTTEKILVKFKFFFLNPKNINFWKKWVKKQYNNSNRQHVFDRGELFYYFHFGNERFRRLIVQVVPRPGIIPEAKWNSDKVKFINNTLY